MLIVLWWIVWWIIRNNLIIKGSNFIFQQYVDNEFLK